MLTTTKFGKMMAMLATSVAPEVLSPRGSNSSAGSPAALRDVASLTSLVHELQAERAQSAARIAALEQRMAAMERMALPTRASPGPWSLTLLSTAAENKGDS